MAIITVYQGASGSGEELAKIAKEVIDQPPEVVERIKKILAQ